MDESSKATEKSVKCPAGHPARLLVKKGTPNLIQTIQCPTCGTDIMVIAGEIQRVESSD